MKAMIYTRYGSPDVLKLVDIPTPTPKDNEVLIKVRATTVTIGDTIMRSLRIPGPAWQRVMGRLFLGPIKPRRPILGMELAGDIIAVGKQVTRFKQGDAVFASTVSVDFGGYAEYKCLPETGMLAIKPTNLTYEEAAAAVGGGMTALRCLSQAHIQRGQKVLIYGASGAVGTNAVQIAKHYGAHVTGVCSAANLEMVKTIGADKVLDYTAAGFGSGDDRYDVVFDAVGKLAPNLARKLLKNGGISLEVHKASGNREKLDDLLAIKQMLEAHTLKPVIDRCYPFAQIVEAHRYVDQGHKKGNVAILVA